MSTTIKIGKVFYDLDQPIYGAKTIGTVINRSERQAFYLLESGFLPASKVGPTPKSSETDRRTWASTPRRILRPIIGDDGIAALVAAAEAAAFIEYHVGHSDEPLTQERKSSATTESS